MQSTRCVGYESTLGTRAPLAREHVGQEAREHVQHVTSVLVVSILSFPNIFCSGNLFYAKLA